MKIKDALIKYVDAGYPIIYINSFEETKTDAMIRDVMGGSEGLEWNGAYGFCSFQTKQSFLEDKSLAETLRMLAADKELERKFLVIKDAHDYRLKDTLKKVAKEAGQCGLREIAADVFAKASEDGLAAVIQDKDFVTDTLVDGANVGLKVALSAGLAVAEDSGVIPPTSFHVLATIAHKTVESFSAFKDVIKGRRSLTDALIHIKDTAVSTFSGLWAKHGTAIREEIVDTVGAVFGMKGAVIAGAIHGALMKNTEGSKFVTVIKEAGKAAVRFFTKEIKLPFFNKTKALQLNMNDA
ncbi:MAG: hypothetical protein VZR73_03960 [Acutalibacteraceae bacterium]|nr:hypothetical protein [Acutalibacteraceae bacterium]